jgi:hypothetical protein
MPVLRMHGEQPVHQRDRRTMRLVRQRSHRLHGAWLHRSVSCGRLERTAPRFYGALQKRQKPQKEECSMKNTLVQGIASCAGCDRPHSEEGKYCASCRYEAAELNRKWEELQKKHSRATTSTGKRLSLLPMGATQAPPNRWRIPGRFLMATVIVGSLYIFKELIALFLDWIQKGGRLWQ